MALAIIDWRTYRLPDWLNGFLLVTGLAAAAWFASDRWLLHLFAAGLGFALFALVSMLYLRLRDQDGLGLGDAKLLGALGAWVALDGLPTVVFLAAIVAIVFALVASAFGLRKLSDRLPFGPFLAMAGWIVWLYGPLGFPEFPA